MQIVKRKNGEELTGDDLWTLLSEIHWDVRKGFIYKHDIEQ